MLRADDHVGGPEQGVRPGGVHGELFAGGQGEVHLRPLAAADPVALLGLHLVDEVHLVQPVQQLLGVVGDAQHPLALHPAHHFAAAALAYAPYHFLVGQAALAAGTPVDGHFLLIGQAVLEQLEEDELGPLVVAGVGGVDLPGIVEGKAQPLELLPEVVHVLLGDHCGLYAGLDGVVLRGQAEGVVPDGEQHVVSFHPPLAGDDIHGRVATGMPHVQPHARRIGELDQRIKLGLVVAGLGVEGAFLLPIGLPFLFDGFRIVDGYLFHAHYPLIQKSAFRPRRDGRRCLSRYHSRWPRRGPLLPDNGGGRPCGALRGRA